MDIKELRIGNWVQCKSDSQRVMITYISIDMPIGELDPIPLTEKILLGCGFRPLYTINKEKMGLSLTLIDEYDESISIDIHNQNGELKSYLTISLSGSYLDLDIDIKYLHQLQNLFFSLTGKELEVKF